MVILKVEIKIKPEHVEAFQTATIENARNSAMEPGVARFDFVQATDDPTHFVLWEVYHQESDIALHKATAHYATWAETVAHMFDGDRTRRFYNNVFPSNENW